MRVRFAAIALALLAATPAGCRDAAPTASGKPDLYLITSLPLLFGERFGLGFAKPDIVRALEKAFVVKPVDLPSQVPADATLLMAQPRALPAEELVALDNWVRAGGHLLLLADPRLEWPSRRPLGDRLRPPPMFADTGLLGHWGLRLDSPDKPGAAESTDDRGSIVYLSPGRLVKVGGDCIVERDSIVATCRLGEGEAIVVADADWLDMPRVEEIAGQHIRADDRLLAMLARKPAVR